MIEIIRREAKFLLPKKIKSLVEREIKKHMLPDQHAMGYPVRSLYLDSPKDMRYRLRAYSNNEDASPIFFEIKGRGPLGKFKRRTEIRDLEMLQELVPAVRPKLLVGYDRKAFENVEDYLRVTIDENIWASKAECLFPIEPSTFSLPFVVIMEVKHKDTVPQWLEELITDYGLQKASMSKFERCSELMRVKHGD